MIKAVIIGFAHMHVNEVALYITENPDIQLCAVSDVEDRASDLLKLRYTPAWNLQNVMENYRPNYFDSYLEMLDTVKPDIAFIMTENDRKAEVVLECAKRKINTSVEKPVADSIDNALKIQSYVRTYGTECFVNWPVLWRPYVLKMKAALDSGIIGKPLKLRYINGHTGPLGKGAKHRGVSANAEEMTDDQRASTWWHKSERGGGVFLDICCYGCLFSRWFFGDGAKAVYAHGQNLNSPFGNTEDDFAAIIRYDGQMSVIEGTWITPRAVIPSGPTLLGTEGILVCTGGAENAPDIKCFDVYGKELELPEVTFDDAFKNMPYHYASHVKNGTPMHEMLTLDANIDVMKLLSAAVKSNVEGCEVSLEG